MVITCMILTFFFRVNDSIVTIKKGNVRVISAEDTCFTLVYSGKIEDYEAGHYYYTNSLIKEINIREKNDKVFMEIKLNKKRQLLIKDRKIVFKKHSKKFYLKTKNISSRELKKLLRSVNLNLTCLDSLKERDYTISGNFTEESLKKELLNDGRGKETYKVKKR